MCSSRPYDYRSVITSPETWSDPQIKSGSESVLNRIMEKVYNSLEPDHLFLKDVLTQVKPVDGTVNFKGVSGQNVTFSLKIDDTDDCYSFDLKVRWPDRCVAWIIRRY